MKASAFCSALLAAPALGAALRGRQSAGYQVTDFIGNCIPHSLYCIYDFHLTTTDAASSSSSSSSETPTHCSIIQQGPDLLPAVDATGCEDAAYSWSVALRNGSLGFTVTSALDAATNLTGVHTIGRDQLDLAADETAISQYYKGPPDFTIGAQGVAV